MLVLRLFPILSGESPQGWAFLSEVFFSSSLAPKHSCPKCFYFFFMIGSEAFLSKVFLFLFHVWLESSKAFLSKVFLFLVQSVSISFSWLARKHSCPRCFYFFFIFGSKAFLSKVFLFLVHDWLERKRNVLQVQKDTARLQRGPVTVGVLREVDGQENKSTSMNLHFEECPLSRRKKTNNSGINLRFWKLSGMLSLALCPPNPPYQY